METSQESDEGCHAARHNIMKVSETVLSNHLVKITAKQLRVPKTMRHLQQNLNGSLKPPPYRCNSVDVIWSLKFHQHKSREIFSDFRRCLIITTTHQHIMPSMSPLSCAAAHYKEIMPCKKCYMPLSNKVNQ